VFPDSAGGYTRGSNVRRRWWSQAVAAAQLFPSTVTDAAGSDVEAVGVAINALLTRNCGQNVVNGTESTSALLERNTA